MLVATRTFIIIGSWLENIKTFDLKYFMFMMSMIFLGVRLGRESIV